VKVRFSMAHLKGNLDGRIQAFDFLSKMIACRIERQAVNAFTKNFVFWQQLSTATVSIRAGRTEHAPFAGGLFPLEAHWHIFRRLALRDIQNVRRNSIHEESHFFSLRCAICRCCSAASCSSVFSSFGKRRRRISRISGADLPVAQTIKMRLNRCS